MPLTAILNGERLQAPFVSTERWATLKGQHFVMACGARGIARTSKLGTQHFAHYRVDHKPETAEHLLTKAAIIRAAIECGWEATDEVRADDGSWIADVLAIKGTRKIAFEVQWSRQHADEYARRTRRYTAAELETIWFARHFDPIDLAAVPVMRLSITDETPLVEQPRGRRAPVDIAIAVTAILTGKFVWQHDEDGPAVAEVVWCVESCWKCRQYSVVFSPDDTEVAYCPHCPATKRRPRRKTLWKDHVAAAAAKAGAGEFPVAALGSRPTKQYPSGEVGFSCPHCKAAFGWPFIRHLWEHLDARVVEVEIGTGILAPHWCIPRVDERPPQHPPTVRK